jgi:hypothetical protein
MGKAIVNRERAQIITSWLGVCQQYSGGMLIKRTDRPDEIGSKVVPLDRFFIFIFSPCIFNREFKVLRRLLFTSVAMEVAKC